MSPQIYRTEWQEQHQKPKQGKKTHNSGTQADVDNGICGFIFLPVKVCEFLTKLWAVMEHNFIFYIHIYIYVKNVQKICHSVNFDIKWEPQFEIFFLTLNIQEFYVKYYIGLEYTGNTKTVYLYNIYTFYIK